MQPLDYTRVAVIGFDLSEEIPESTVMLCDGCRKEIRIQKEPYAICRQRCFEQGQALHVVCDECAKPWMDKANRGEVVAWASPDNHDQLVRQLERRRDEKLGMN